MKVCEGAEWVDASGSGDPRRSSLSSSSGGWAGRPAVPTRRVSIVHPARQRTVTFAGSPAYLHESRGRPPTDVHRISQP